MWRLSARWASRLDFPSLMLSRVGAAACSGPGAAVGKPANVATGPVGAAACGGPGAAAWRLRCGTGGGTEARAGGWVQAEKQQRYLQLIAQGVNNSEACRLVGINRKTGNRWRYGRRVRNSAGVLVIYPPVKAKEARPRSPRYLSEHERIQIADLLAAKTSGARHRSGVGALAVDDQPRDRSQQRSGRALSPHHAEHAARLRAASRASGGSLSTVVLAEAVQRLLAKRWSPEQVAHELRVLFAGQPLRWLCKESIYQAIYDTAVTLRGRRGVAP